MSEADDRDIVHPTLHHLGLTTANQGLLVDWYAKVLGTQVTHASSHPRGLTHRLVSQRLGSQAMQPTIGLGLSESPG